MSKKKIIGEDGKTYNVKVKKPFYKRVWFWVLIILIIAGIGGSLGGGNSDKNNTTTKSSSTSASKVSPQNKHDTGKITREQFDAIKIGDLMNGGQGGDNFESLQQKFGKPSDTSSSTTDGVKTDIDTWNNVEGGFGANIIVTFTDGNAVAKNLTGFKLSRKQSIKLADFESFTNGEKYDDFTAKWGQPDYYDETLVGGQTTVIAGYTSGVKGDLGANFNVTFTNGELTGKSQNSMK